MQLIKTFLALGNRIRSSAVRGAGLRCLSSCTPSPLAASLEVGLRGVSSQAAPYEPPLSFNSSLNQYRAQYSKACWDQIAGLFPSAAAQPAVAVDIAVGSVGRTGVELSKRGFEVTCISNDPEVLSKTVGHAAAEETQISLLTMKAGRRMLGSGNVDLVTCMHNMHIVDVPAALAAAHYLLKPSGKLCVAWNETDFGDAFIKEVEELIQRSWPPGSYDRSSAHLTHTFEHWAPILQQGDLFALVSHSVHPNPLLLPSTAAFVDIMRQAPWMDSVLPDEAARRRLLAQVQHVAERCYGEGPLRLPFLTKLFVLEKQQSFSSSLLSDID